MATDGHKEKEHDKDTSMSTSEAGRMGGNKVRDERGPEFYSEIGRQQGKDNNPGNFANRPKEDVQEAGRRGGEARGKQREDGEDMQDDMDTAA
jgi:general stress protein YciG